MMTRRGKKHVHPLWETCPSRFGFLLDTSNFAPTCDFLSRTPATDLASPACFLWASSWLPEGNHPKGTNSRTTPKHPKGVAQNGGPPPCGWYLERSQREICPFWGYPSSNMAPVGGCLENQFTLQGALQGPSVSHVRGRGVPLLCETSSPRFRENGSLYFTAIIRSLASACSRSRSLAASRRSLESPRVPKGPAPNHQPRGAYIIISLCGGGGRMHSTAEIFKRAAKSEVKAVVWVSHGHVLGTRTSKLTGFLVCHSFVW